MRIAGGLEACVIDNGVLTITALDPDDVRAHKMFGEASAIGLLPITAVSPSPADPVASRG